MKRCLNSLLLLGAILILLRPTYVTGSTTALESATVVEIKNQVDYQSADGSERAAKQQDVVSGRDIVKTGSSSMAELEFADKTLTRLGSHSAFTFAAESREVQTHSGLSVFFIPKGLGGLRVVARAVVGAVEGCTVVVEEVDRPQGGVMEHWTKFLLVEGTRARIWLPDGSDTMPLREGQGVFQREGDPKLSPPFDFDVKALTENATIFTGFQRPWPGLDAINAVIDRQFHDLQAGKMKHASTYWTGRGTQQGALPAQYAVPDIPTISTPPYNDSGARDGSLIYIGGNICGCNQPTK